MKTFREFITENFKDFTKENNKAETGYLYHGTTVENAHDIKDHGHLITHKPNHGSEQDSWPDGSKEKRSYWTHEPNIAKSFVPEGKPALLRTKHESHFQKEKGTGDHYTKKNTPVEKLEYFHHDGSWKNLKDI